MQQWANGENGAIYYYTSDLPGNVTGLFRANGSSTTLANEYRYTPWGEAEVRQEGTPNPLRYMSREIDGGTGLYYVRNRWYDVQLGRFLSEDPIGLEGGINWYAYAANSPTNLRDPFGLEPCVITYSYKYYKDTGEVIRESVRIIHVTGDCEGTGGGADGAGGTPSSKEIERCPAVPRRPPGVSVNRNIRKAQLQRLNPASQLWFFTQVRNGGPWDYKQLDSSKYAAFGNFNYGATGRAVGFTPAILLAAAGAAQMRSGNYDPANGTPTTGPPYGDDPVDQLWIQLGIDYYDQRCYFFRR